jgi:hypothetical protein
MLFCFVDWEIGACKNESKSTVELLQLKKYLQEKRKRKSFGIQ